MTRYGRAPAGSLRRRRADHGTKPALFLMLGLLAAVAMPPAARAQGTGPNPLCTACHNPDGNSTIPENPKLAGLDAEYIAKQLADFRKHKRVSETMGPMAGQITEADIEVLAAYYSEQKPAPGVVADPKLAAQGQVIYDEGIVGSAVPACSGCHNEDGSGTAKYPRLAGQHTAYLIQQMKNFKSGTRNNDVREVMSAVAKRMSEQEMKAVAEYIAGLKGSER